MNNSWKSVAIAVIFFIIGFIAGVSAYFSTERTHIGYGHTPYIDKDMGLMWQSHKIVERGNR